MKKLLVSIIFILILNLTSCVFDSGKSCKYVISACDYQSQMLYDKIQDCNKKNKKIKLNCCASYEDRLNICKYYQENPKLSDYSSDKQKNCLENIKNLSCEEIKNLDTVEKILKNGINSCFDFQRKTKKDTCKENYKNYCKNLMGCSQYHDKCKNLDEEKLEIYCNDAGYESISEDDIFTCHYLYDNVKKSCKDIPKEFIFEFENDSWKESFPKDLCNKKPKMTKQDACYQNYQNYCNANYSECSNNLKGPCESFLDAGNYEEHKTFSTYKIYEYCASTENPDKQIDKSDNFSCPELYTLMKKTCYDNQEFVFDFRNDSWKENYQSLCKTERTMKKDICFENYENYLNDKQRRCGKDSINSYSDLLDNKSIYNVNPSKLYSYCSKTSNPDKQMDKSDIISYECLSSLKCDEYFDFRNDSWKESSLFSNCQ